VIGEGQILSQVKHTYKLGQQHESDASLISYSSKLMAAKQVRTETRSVQVLVSVSSAFGTASPNQITNLSDRRVTIVGAGNMARRLVQHLAS